MSKGLKYIFIGYGNLTSSILMLILFWLFFDSLVIKVILSVGLLFLNIFVFIKIFKQLKKK